MRIVLTGATGLLGRNLLFEILKRNLNHLDSLELFVLGRNNKEVTISQRIQRILSGDGYLYIGIDPESQKAKEINSSIKCISMNLDHHKLNMDPQDYEILKSKPIDVFFHVAACTDFRDTPNVVEMLKVINVEGTRHILELIDTLDVKELCFTGTAYSCGKTYGKIRTDYINLAQEFRNPYERSKLEAELLVREYSKKSGLKCKYFRPSTIAGRLMEKPHGAVNKFDVFYSWAAFFLYLKTKQLNKIDYETPTKIDLRICYSMNSGLNIVPSDYAAKIMYEVHLNGTPEETYYLVNEKETPHHMYIPVMLNTIKVTGVDRVAEIPKDMNHLEKIYYKTVGKIFTPYINTDPTEFDLSNLEPIFKRSGITCPNVGKDEFTALIDFAKQYNFGM
ncbi:MAG TPA: SDR family oxidoreductase [Candidatus Omnitrophota bacterium]|nr:SDR family oxidoreductase [Candidatus Omnitrophota bacterium]